MRMIDTWDIDTGTTYSMVAGEDYLLGTVDNNIYVASLDSLGFLQGDSLILSSYRTGPGYSYLKDSLLFLTYNPELGIDSCHIFNIANPHNPDKIKSFHLYDGVEPYYQVVQDTILFLLNYSIKLSLADLDSTTPISYMINESLARRILENGFSYPYLYGLFISYPAIGDECPWVITIDNWSSNDTVDGLLIDTLRVDSYPYNERWIKSIYAQDTIIFASIRGSSDNPNDTSFIVTMGVNASRDSAWLASVTKDFQHFGHIRSAGNLWIFDSLLIMVTGNAINIFDISDPVNPEEVAYYYNEDYSFKTPILKDSLLYINYNRGDTAGIATFEYPCTTCDGNCELEQEIPNELNIDVYPNPFNSICQIKYNLQGKNIPVNLEILDINGKIIESYENLPSESIINWDASNNPAGVYLIRLSNGEENLVEKVIYMK